MGERIWSFGEGELLLDGRFEIQRRLSQGGMGEVYLVWDDLVRGQRVLKMLLTQRLESAGYDEDSALRMLRREVQRLQAVKHVGVPLCYGMHEFEWNGRTIRLLEQEYIKGQTLEEMFVVDKRTGYIEPFAEERCLKVMGDVLEVLAHIHSLRDEKGDVSPLLHLDIKPGNLMWSEKSQRWLLIDFGLAVQVKKTGSMAVSYSLLGAGTPGYMPPEQSNLPCPASDLYALGVTFLQMRTGMPPTEIAIVLKARSEEPRKRLLGNVDRRLQGFVDKMTRYHDEERYHDGVVALDAFQKALAPPPLLAVSASSRGDGTLSVFAWLALLMMFALLLLGLVFFLKPWPEREGGIREGGVVEKRPRLEPHPPEAQPEAQPEPRLEAQPEAQPEPRPEPQPPERAKEPEAGELRVFDVGGVAFRMRWVPAGEFTMGSPADDAGRSNNEGPQRLVKISRGYWMMEHEVTQGQWKAFSGGENPSGFKDCGNKCPVERVSWVESALFANKVSQKAGLPSCFTGDGKGGVGDGGKDYVDCKGWRLPTEAEWEYAARAGTTTAFSTGKCLSTDQANYDGNFPQSGCPTGVYREKTVKVCTFAEAAKHPWNLCDVHGNVWEWVYDWYHADAYKQLSGDAPSVDPVFVKTGSLRSGRGGGWSNFAGSTLSANRGGFTPTRRDNDLGLRLLRR